MTPRDILYTWHPLAHEEGQTGLSYIFPCEFDPCLYHIGDPWISRWMLMIKA